MLLVETQAGGDNLQHLLLTVNCGQFPGKPGMASELAAQLDPESPGTLGKGAGGADLDALAAVQAAGKINPGILRIPFKGNRVFPAGLQAGFTLAAGFFSQPRRAGTDDTDVFYLGLGTGIGAVGQGDSKFMVKFEVSSHAFAQKSQQVFFIRASMDSSNPSLAIARLGHPPGPKQVSIW